MQHRRLPNSARGVLLIAALVCLGLETSRDVRAAAITGNQQYGASTLGSGSTRPLAFINAALNNFYTNEYTGSSWIWNAHGTPGGGPTGVGQGYGSTTVGSGSGTLPLTFVATSGSTPILYCLDYGFTRPANWTWTSISSAAGYLPVGASDLTMGSTQYPYVFTHDSVNIQVFGWNINTSTFDLRAQTRPPGTTGIKFGVGALAVSTGGNYVPHAYVVASDGNLWDYYYTGVAGTWTNHGKPSPTLNTAVGTTIIASGSRPFIFLEASDGNLWSRSFSNGAWVWFNHGRPTGVTLSTPMGATCGSSCGQPFAFVKGSDSNLWSMSWNGAWVWTNHSRPAGVTFASSVGATAVSADRPYVFITGSDGNLWLRWWSGSAWAWSNQGHP